MQKVKPKKALGQHFLTAVSYKHLTLPTIVRADMFVLIMLLTRMCVWSSMVCGSLVVE